MTDDHHDDDHQGTGQAELLPDTVVIGLSQVSGSYWPIRLTGPELVGRIFGDDIGAPARSVSVTGVDSDGRTVTISIGVPRKPRR